MSDETATMPTGAEAYLIELSPRVTAGEPISSLAGETYFRAVQLGFEGPQSAWSRKLCDLRQSPSSGEESETDDAPL